MRSRWILVTLALCAAACGDQAGDVPSGDESALRTAGLLATRDVASKADPALLAAVKGIEARGGTGGWFRSVLPWDGAKRDLYYFLRTAPATVDPQAPMLLLRLEHSRAALADAIREGTPIVIGKMPAAFQAAAAAFSELPIATDALTAAGIQGKKSVVFLPPDTLRTTFAHELQHYRDYEDAAFRSRFEAAATPFLSAPYLTDDDKADLDRIVIELRGHGMGERQARADLEKRNPMLLRGGVPVAAADLTGSYEADAANQVNVFLSAYRPVLRAISNKVKAREPAHHDKLVDLIATFNLAPEASRLHGVLVR